MLKIVLVLHILGATIWTGGHLVLALTVLPRALRRRDVALLRDFEEGYEKIGIPALLVLVVTGLWLAHRVLPQVSDWVAFDTVVGRHVAIKLMLLLATLGLAVHARLRLIPRLSEQSLPVLAWHVAGVTVLAVLFVIAGVGLRTGGIF